MDKKTLKDLEMVLDKKLDQKLDPIKKVQGEHSSKLDALTLDMLDMIDVQKKTDMIADIHDMSKDTKERVDNHEQRIQTIESAS